MKRGAQNGGGLARQGSLTPGGAARQGSQGAPSEGLRRTSSTSANARNAPLKRTPMLHEQVGGAMGHMHGRMRD